MHIDAWLVTKAKKTSYTPLDYRIISKKNTEPKAIEKKITAIFVMVH